MSNEVQTVIISTPTTAYFVVLNSVGQFWNDLTAAFESYNASNWVATKYPITLTRQGSSFHYFGTFPTGITTAGKYSLVGYAQAGASPAITDDVIGSDDNFQWDGSGVKSLAGVGVTDVNGSTTAASRLGTFWGGVESGTAQAGSSTSITLASGASAVDNFYDYMAIKIESGTGVGQTRKILPGYNGTTKVATVAAWATIPDNTSVYSILGRIE